MNKQDIIRDNDGVKRTIAEMLIMETEKYDKLMRGEVINLDRIELDNYITCQNQLGINTLQIQRGHLGYSIKVDEPTIRRYLALGKGRQLMIYREPNPIKRYEQILKKGV